MLYLLFSQIQHIILHRRHSFTHSHVIKLHQSLPLNPPHLNVFIVLRFQLSRQLLFTTLNNPLAKHTYCPSRNITASNCPSQTNTQIRRRIPCFLTKRRIFIRLFQIRQRCCNQRPFSRSHLLHISPRIRNMLKTFSRPAYKFIGRCSRRRHFMRSCSQSAQRCPHQRIIQHPRPRTNRPLSLRLRFHHIFKSGFKTITIRKIIRFHKQIRGIKRRIRNLLRRNRHLAHRIRSRHRLSKLVPKRLLTHRTNTARFPPHLCRNLRPLFLKLPLLNPCLQSPALAPLFFLTLNPLAHPR